MFNNNNAKANYKYTQNFASEAKLGMACISAFSDIYYIYLKIMLGRY